MIKITGPNSVQSGAGTNKKKKGEAASGFGELIGTQESSETQSADSVGGILPTGLVNFNVLPQELPHNLQKRVNHGKELLEELDELRMSLLNQERSPEELNKILANLNSMNDKTDDPKLESIIQQIEMRIAVEQAKWERDA